MTIDDRLRRHLEAEAAGAVITRGSAEEITGVARRRGTRRRVAGAMAAVALLAAAVGGGLALRDDDPAIEISVASNLTAEPNGAVADHTPEDPALNASSDPPAPDGLPPEGGAVVEPPVGIEQDGFVVWGSPAVVYDGDGFAGLRSGPDGVVAVRSRNGVTWTEEPVTGLDRTTAPIGLVWRDGVYAALLHQLPVPDVPAEADGPETAMGWSTDLTNWSTLPLEARAADGMRLTYDSLALGPDSSFVITGLRVSFPDIAVPADPDADCRTESGPNGVSITCESSGTSCEVATPPSGPGAPPDAASPQPDGSIPLCGSGSGIGLDGGPAQLFEPSSLVLAGTLGDVATEVALGVPEPFFLSGIAATDDAFVAIGQGPDVSVARSSDGVEWDTVEVSTQFQPGDILGGLVAGDGRLTAVGFCGGEPVAWTSDDNGTTWTMTTVSGRPDASGFVERVSAGPGRSVAALIRSLPTTDAVEDPPRPPELFIGSVVAYTTDGDRWQRIDLATRPETEERVVLDVVIGDDELLVQLTAGGVHQDPASSFLESIPDTEWVRIAL